MNDQSSMCFSLLDEERELVWQGRVPESDFDAFLNGDSDALEQIIFLDLSQNGTRLSREIIFKVLENIERLKRTF